MALLGGLALPGEPALAGGAEPRPVQSGPAALAPHAVRDLQLAAAPDGSLILATVADAGTYHSGRGSFVARTVTAWRQVGGAWSALGTALNYDHPRPASSLNLALDRAGTPVLVWNENYGDNDVVVFRAYRAGAWTDWRTRYLGDDLPYAARTRAVAAQAGEPVLAWGEWLRKPSGSRLTVRRWNEAQGSWVRGPAFNSIQAFSRTPALGLTRAGQPLVAWLQGDVMASNLYASVWTGSRWKALGGRVNRRADTYLASTRLVPDRQDRPVVAWLEDVQGQDGLYASRWDGERWRALGARLDTAPASAPALALDGQDRPVVAWVQERSRRGQVLLSRWTGRAWQSLGLLNRDPRRDARSPSVAVGPDGQITVAWREDVGGTYRVLLRRFGP